MINTPEARVYFRNPYSGPDKDPYGQAVLCSVSEISADLVFGVNKRPDPLRYHAEPLASDLIRIAQLIPGVCAEQLKRSFQNPNPILLAGKIYVLFDANNDEAPHEFNFYLTNVGHNSDWRAYRTNVDFAPYLTDPIELLKDSHPRDLYRTAVKQPDGSVALMPFTYLYQTINRGELAGLMYPPVIQFAGFYFTPTQGTAGINMSRSRGSG